MKERPISFNDEMVRALLDGRKTQTRRICKSQPYSNGLDFDGHDFVCYTDYLPPSAMLMDIRRGKLHYTTSNLEGWEYECPYGQVGDRLWVRECFSWEFGMDEDSVIYRATDQDLFDGLCNNLRGAGINAMPRWRPSIHMPRWASRITLEITGVRVERLLDISEGDAIAEGAKDIPLSLYNVGNLPESWDKQSIGSARFSFATLWGSIYGPESWAANPWVWVIEFKQVTP